MRGLGWMAILAVWLAALAPTISRVSAWSFPDLGAWCEPADAHHHGDGSQGHGDDGAACGYCTLFAHHPGLAGASFAAGVPRLAVHADASMPARDGFMARATFHAHPRGPPVAAHA
ncbi:DUF2946 domain-containing protein [Luteibacter sp.]|uniref:DUF2946 domain-containing protein n=1 Tax=Luteibacter sp. TaxID=1886636 RepID=UPI003F7EF325